MGGIQCCERMQRFVEADATQWGLEELKAKLEGQTKMVQPDPRIDPEVYVTFDEVLAKEGAAIKFSPVKFTLQDITFRTSVDIVGNKSQLAAAGVAKAVGAAAAKLGTSKDKTVDAVVGVANKVLAGKDAAKESRMVKVHVTVDLVKELGDERVNVWVKDIHTKLEGGMAQDKMSALGEQVLSNDNIRGYLEKAISDKASEVATRMAKAKTDAALAKVGMA